MAKAANLCSKNLIGIREPAPERFRDNVQRNSEIENEIIDLECLKRMLDNRHFMEREPSPQQSSTGSRIRISGCCRQILAPIP